MERREQPAGEAREHGVEVEQRGDDHQRQKARHDEVLDRVDAQHLQRVQLLADLARTEVGGDRSAAHARQDDRGDGRPELADRGEHEEAAEPVDGAEQDEEVARLQTWRTVGDHEHRDRQRQPTQAHEEEELLHELAAVDVWRPDRADQRLAGQDHHVADLIEQVLGRQHHARLHRQPPSGARGLEPQKICVPNIPMMWTITVLSTIDLAVAAPTPTGPPLAV